MKKNTNKSVYGIVFASLVIFYFFMFRLINYGRTELIEPLKNMSSSIVTYIKYIEDNDRNVSTVCFDYFNKQVHDMQIDLKNDKETTQSILDDFNLLFVEPEDSCLIFSDGTFVSSTNSDDSIMQNHNLIGEEPYIRALENFGFAATKYNEAGNNKITYSYPLFDKNNNVIGIIAKSRTIDYIIKQLEQIDLSLIESTLIITDLEDNPLVILDENGSTKGTEMELVEIVDNLKSKSRAKTLEYVDDYFGLKYVFIPTKDSEMIKFNVTMAICNMLCLSIIMIMMILIVLKRDNYKATLIVCTIVAFFETAVFYISFSFNNNAQMLKELNININIANLKEKNDEDIQDVLQLFAGNLIYNNLTNEQLVAENSMQIIKETLYKSSDLDLLQFMGFDNAYILKGNDVYDLVSGEISQASGNLMGLYEKIVRNQKVLNKNIFIDHANRKCEIIKTYTMKNKDASIVFALTYDGFSKEEKFYQNFIIDENIDEICYVETVDNELLVSQCKVEGKSTVRFHQLDINSVKNEKLYDTINEFKNSDLNSKFIKFIDSDVKEVDAVIAKSYDTKQMFVVSAELLENFFVRFKIANLVFGTMLTLGLSIFLKYRLDKYYSSKKEGVTLHGNY